MTELTTSLRLLREHNACSDRYDHLRKKLGRGYGVDTPITIERVLDLNGLDDALWALQATAQPKEVERMARLLACDFVCSTPLGDGRVVYGLLLDEYSRNAVKVAEAFAYGKATSAELVAARAAAWDAVRDAAWDAVRDAAWAAARAAAWAAAKAAAWDAAWDAARKWQTACLRLWLEAERGGQG